MAGKVISCPNQMVIRYRFVRRPSPTALDELESWLEEQRSAIANFHWLEDGWIMKINMRRRDRTDLMAEMAVDLRNYLRRNGFAAAWY